MASWPSDTPLPHDIKNALEAVLLYGGANDEIVKKFQEKSIRKLADLLVHKYRVREIEAFLDGRKKRKCST